MKPVFISTNTFSFSKGTIIENYKKTKGGILVENDFISDKNFIILTEKLSTEDERRIKEIIKQQLHGLLWNLYTKMNVIVPN